MPDFSEEMAKMNITWNGQNGELPDPVSFDASDEELRNIAEESVRSGYVPGIDADEDVDFTDFVVDRFAAVEDVPFAKVVIRPKTPFGKQ